MIDDELEIKYYVIKIDRLFDRDKLIECLKDASYMTNVKGMNLIQGLAIARCIDKCQGDKKHD